MAHIHEKIDFTASVYIVHDARVLLHMHRKLQKWLPPGGHIELDEDPNEAVIREAREETGLEIELVGERMLLENDVERELIPPRFLNRHWFNADKTHEHVDLVYFARISGGELKAEEGGNLPEWFDEVRLEAEQSLIPRVSYYARKAISELG